MLSTVTQRKNELAYRDWSDTMVLVIPASDMDMRAVEKVLAGAIRREMSVEEFCTKQHTEIMQLNRLIFNTTKGLITVELYKEGSPEVVDEFIDVSCVDVLLLEVDMSSPVGIHTSLHKDGMPNVLDMSSDVRGSVLLSVGTHHSADERTQDTGNPHSISQSVFRLYCDAQPSTSREPEKDPNNSAQDKSLENELAILHMAKESRIVYLLGHVSILCASYLHVLGLDI
ncbi:kinesin-like protein KIN-12B [Tanacetum coccineum]